MNENNHLNLFHYFIQRDIAIITIIGVMVAISKYFNDTTDADILIVSILASLFAIFLLVVLIIDALWLIGKRMYIEREKPIMELLGSFVSYIGICITICFVLLLVIALGVVTFKSHPSEVSLIFLSVESLVGFAIGLILSFFIIMKTNTVNKLFFTMVGIIIVMTILSAAIGKAPPMTELINNPSGHLMEILVFWAFTSAMICLIVSIGKGYYWMVTRKPDSWDKK
jgi:hypothetical protein